MLSKTFRAVIEDIDRDLGDEVLSAAYTGELREQIVRIRNEIASVIGRAAMEEETSVAQYEYKYVYLTSGMATHHDNFETGYQFFPEAIATNIPDHEIDGWIFVCMMGNHNGLFRRKKR